MRELFSMNRASARVGSAFVTLALGVLALGACSSSTDADAGNQLPTSASGPGGATTSGKISVVAAENFWGNIASQIGGDKVEVTSIISDPSTDPHEYETSARDAAAISAANLVIENGVGYDDFVAKLLHASTKSGRDVVNIEDAVRPAGANPNPHLWYEPSYVDEGARAIEAQLAKQAPAHASAFAANLTSFLAGEQQVADVITQIRNKYAGTEIAYKERVPGYLVMAAGLTLGMPESFARSIEDGDDPTPGDSVTFQAALTGHKVKVLLYNAQAGTPATQKLRDVARHSDIPVVAVTETMPAGAKDFQTWQGDQAKALLAALGG
jgi:zinc/manganese transport system substrate-binding protein